VVGHADGTPRRINQQDVAIVREEWRVVDRWWTDEPVQRRYFDVVLETGENAVVYHDVVYHDVVYHDVVYPSGEVGRWYSQRA
jgi:hypothetical protein